MIGDNVAHPALEHLGVPQEELEKKMVWACLQKRLTHDPGLELRNRAEQANVHTSKQGLRRLDIIFKM